MANSSLPEMETSRVIRAIKMGEERALDKIYLSYRISFLNWASARFSLSKTDLADCWQESIIAFYEQIAVGRLQTLEVNLQTYLFAIGRNKILMKLRSQENRRKKEQIFAGNYFLEERQSNGYFGLEEVEEDQKRILQKAMQSLSKKNRTLLIHRYYEGLSLEKIQQKENYKSINAVSATLSRAVALLRKIVRNENNVLILLFFYNFWQ